MKIAWFDIVDFCVISLRVAVCAVVGATVTESLECSWVVGLVVSVYFFCVLTPGCRDFWEVTLQKADWERWKDEEMYRQHRGEKR